MNDDGKLAPHKMGLFLVSNSTCRGIAGVQAKQDLSCTANADVKVM